MYFLFLNAIPFLILLLACKNSSKTFFIIFNLRAIIAIYVICILGNLCFFFLIIIDDHYFLLLMIINYYWLLLVIINYYSPLLMMIIAEYY